MVFERFRAIAPTLYLLGSGATSLHAYVYLEFACNGLRSPSTHEFPRELLPKRCRSILLRILMDNSHLLGPVGSLVVLLKAKVLSNLQERKTSCRHGSRAVASSEGRGNEFVARAN
jgi:hypothetical protein